jgi:hypothetical protein
MAIRRIRMQTTPRLILTALLLAACQREEVTHFRIAKPTQATPPPASAPAPMAADLTAVPGMEPAKPTNALAWTLPAGWTQAVAGGMRYATIKPATGEVDVSVVVLPGTAGGELANVNRWRGQLGVAPLDDSSAQSARSLVQTKTGPFALYDFQSDGAKPSRMIAARAVFDGNTWFFKMLGEPRAVGSARTDFIHLLESLHVE